MNNIILIILALALGIFINAVILLVLLKKKIKFWESVKLTCTATALNKLFLTGSGYIAMSWKLKGNNLALHKSLSAFAVMELLSLLPWLISGCYFGAKGALRVSVFLIVPFLLSISFVIFKKGKTLIFMQEVLKYLKEIKLGIFTVMPLVLLHFVIGVSYYFFLIKAFGFVLPALDVLKIATVSVSVGYLSPAPSGLGFKEGALVFLLKQQNISLKDALAIALTDRLIVTFFYLVIGLLVGAEIITCAMRERRRCKSGNFT